ncbi:putative O-methyltransferase YrrM [Hephaestia caeni]|uniref:Putative O-methyltransferase YrrM n=1 Tax=Hephaestia caeni TaxID=645617 RepID=A0A397PAN2_9SPHN|nr:O-methyltransferase [Hephaestia caeni]RIA46626.1 putative O-methyltransferase YrrM [Hephaestia caeni]
MSDPRWTEVDHYIEGKLLGDDAALGAALAANHDGGLPAIDVSAAQGRFLHLLALAGRAARILEVGTLGGYSTIELARGLAEGGRVVTLEIDPHHAEVARANIDRAGLSDRVDIRVAPAINTLDAMVAGGEAPFDLVFIDADKTGNAAYFDRAVALSRPGTIIIVDNVIRDGGVIDPASDDAAIKGTRALFDALERDDRVVATAVQTVGVKKWDGFVMAVVK